MSPDFSLHRGAIPKKKKRVKTFVKNYGLELFLFSLSYIMGKLYGISMGLSSSKCTSKNTNYNAAFEKRVSDNAQMRLLHMISEAGNDPALNSKFASKVVRVNKDEFTKMYEFGNPIDKGNGTDMEHGLIIYNEKALLNSDLSNSVSGNIEDIPLMPNPRDATRNCDVMNVAVIKGGEATCTAIVGGGFGQESNHILQWIRTKPGIRNGPLKSLPLVKVGRGTMGRNGSDRFSPISNKNQLDHQALLKSYLNHLDDVLAELEPIAKRVANDNKEIIVMTSNFGQSVLLENFVCNARSKNFDLSNLLVFPTDDETFQLAKGMGIEAFYDKKNFGALPTREANSYGDRTFVSMMYAKVISVQLINYLGYHVLFQDVDVIWYKHPLMSGVFTSPSSPLSKYDMLFQDDGAHSLRYIPYAANTGFYYVRHSDRTRYFFTQFLYNGSLIYRTSSHQAALIALLAEHASLYGLRVKVLDGLEFPGGFHYHRKKDFMKSIVKKEVEPYVFHMSWTKNKDDKLLYMKQMGMWYTNEKCVDKESKQIHVDDSDVKTPPLVSACCAAEPLLSCHYRDKPSAIPCTDSPPIDKGRPSFW